MKIAVSTASGVEAVTKRELNKLGILDAPAVNGRITFDGDFSDIVKSNLYLRTANRVYIVLGEFRAESFDELFDGIFALDFKQFIPLDGNIIVNAKCVSSKIYAISATQSIVKKAVCEKLKKQYNTSTLFENGERYKIEASIFKDYCTISIDTSGEGLHRRGYRKLVGDAPLKETLAAAMLELSVWNPSRPFADVFCGTGTLVIEAALMAKNIPSGYMRDFDFLHWKCFDKRIFSDEKSKAEENIVQKLDHKLLGFDIDDKQLELSRKHAELANVLDAVHFQKADMREFSSKNPRGIIISNPPYGERLSDRAEIEKLYRDYGKMAEKLPSWCVYTLTPVTDFERLFGKKADKKRKLYNGNIECFYYSHLAELKK